jgi:hypothetical protein
MVKHGALSKSHVYHLLRSNDARVRHAAFTLLERSNPTLRTNSGLFVEIAQFIWNANPSYEVWTAANNPRNVNPNTRAIRFPSVAFFV